MRIFMYVMGNISVCSVHNAYETETHIIKQKHHLVRYIYHRIEQTMKSEISQMIDQAVEGTLLLMFQR